MSGSREKQLSALPAEPDPPRGRLARIAERIVRPFRGANVPLPQPATGFFTDTTVCIGCKACEVACKQWNQLPADGFSWTGNSYDNTGELSATSWRHVKFIEQFALPPAVNGPPPDNGAPAADGRIGLDLVAQPVMPNRWLMMSDVCKHCAVAPCQQACPTGAIIHNEFANIYIQPDICNGCSYCIAACPFGVITRASFDGLSHKCTLCYDRQRDGLVPACAKACPTASIQFGPIDQLRDRARQRVDELRGKGTAGAFLYGDESSDTYSSLNSFYLLVDRPAVYGLPEKPFNPWLHMKWDYARSLFGALIGMAVLLFALFWVGH